MTAPAAKAGPDQGPATPAFGVYVHWPFCESKCPYCDFNSHVAETVDQARWARALVSDLAHYAEDTSERTVTTVFFGGGTPSLMRPETVATVIDGIKGLWTTAPDMEISLEANPSSAEIAAFPDLKAAGVTRLSVGVQSFSDDALAGLGRRHDATAARRALAGAREYFQEFSFDLIYARPGQSEASWREELNQALEFAGPHLSFYQLTIEPGTPFHKDGVQAADDETGAALFDATQEILGGAGLPAYEISNHARPGHECRHNLNIWRGWDYVGVGPGAHGRLALGSPGATDDRGTHQIHNPDRWLEKVESQGHGTAKRRKLAARDRARERIIMGLRLSEGMDRARFRAQTGAEVLEFIDDRALAASLDEGYVTLDDARFAATAEGRLRLNGLLAALLKDDDD
ncbi:MAG TPA: coproporphyrinogen III oxidase [Rhodospirillaceae bacterium]|nr:coproporphyrinogen III oxidase [Rhodospirillaceae bacterium]|tara:strand:+ start:179 stop:1384 length:1206 start_codon:yes stop_codon:yes gene_type:complete